jgi:hypothetical protein
MRHACSCLHVFTMPAYDLQTSVLSGLTLLRVLQRMDRGWTALGAVCVQHSSNATGRHQFAGKAGSAAAATAGGWKRSFKSALQCTHVSAAASN